VVPRAIPLQEYAPGVISGQAQISLGIEHGFRGHPDALLNEFRRRSPT
jgi:hypothetical protein